MTETSLIIRPAVQRAWAEQEQRDQSAADLRQRHDLTHTRHTHSPEALAAVKQWQQGGSILAIPTDADWWCWGFDAARGA